MLYPFAPHICEEFWQYLGEKTTITYAPIPKIDHKYLVEDTKTYIIQVNGKLRSKMNLPKTITKDQIIKLAKQDPKVQKFLIGDIINVIFVPEKLLNIVVEKK
jgi:leucyl-tRNA synthetase